MTDLQDPLPEGDWKFRRVFVYGLVLALVGALFLTILLAPTADLQRIAGWLILLIGFVTVLYLVAPSAVEVIRMLSALRPKWLGGPGASA